MKLKQMLSPTRILRATNERHHESRRAFVEALIAQVSTKPAWSRAQLVGPLFLHPVWWRERRGEASALPDFDAVLADYITAASDTARTHDIRLIFTLTPRYAEKALSLLSSEELPRFKSDLLDAIDTLWGLHARTGPDILCLDTGFYQIDYIFPDSLLSQSRLTPSAPTEGGWEYFDLDLVERARSRFDRIFDNNWRGQMAEIETLRQHIAAL